MRRGFPKLPTWTRIVRYPLTRYEAGALASSDGCVRGPADVFRLLRERAQAEEQEVFYAVLVNALSRVLAVQEVTRGTLNATLVHPREVFRTAIAFGAAGVIVAHNHPSGDPTPSADDRKITTQLVDSGKVFGIPLYDHVIIGGERYASCADLGLLV